jgi:hypothetical protein
MQDPSRVEVNEGSPVQLSVHVVRNAFDNAHRCHGLAGNPPEGRVGVVRPEETSCKALVGVLQDAPRDGEVSESAAALPRVVIAGRGAGGDVLGGLRRA